MVPGVTAEHSARRKICSCGSQIPLELQKIAGRVSVGREKQKTQAVVEQCEQSWVGAKHSLQPLQEILLHTHSKQMLTVGQLHA